MTERTKAIRVLTTNTLAFTGGFFCPIIFGYLLEATGIWTTCWMFFSALSVVCLVWMHLVIQRMMREKAPMLMCRMETERVACL